MNRRILPTASSIGEEFSHGQVWILLLSRCVNRAVGITRGKRRLTHTAGIPTARTGRQAKMAKMVTGGRVTPILLLLAFLLIACGAATPTASGILQPSSLPDAPPAPTYTPYPTIVPLGAPQVTGLFMASLPMTLLGKLLMVWLHRAAVWLAVWLFQREIMQTRWR
jgi:hypothetical protein